MESMAAMAEGEEALSGSKRCAKSPLSEESGVQEGVVETAGQVVMEEVLPRLEAAAGEGVEEQVVVAVPVVESSLRLRR
jgi:hypothetical protein